MPTLPQRQRAQVFIEPDDVATQLARIGSPAVWLRAAAWQGNIDRLLVSGFDFSGRAEYDAASRGLRTLRETGGEIGWHPDTYLGIPVVMNSYGTAAIAVTAGDHNTGVLTDTDPMTMSPKGPNTASAAAPKLNLSGDDEFDGAVDFYYLLTRGADDRVFLELSEPVTTKTGRVTEWKRRIIIGETGPIHGAARRVPIAPTPPINIAVPRRIA